MQCECYLLVHCHEQRNKIDDGLQVFGSIIAKVFEQYFVDKANFHTHAQARAHAHKHARAQAHTQDHVNAYVHHHPNPYPRYRPIHINKHP